VRRRWNIGGCFDSAEFEWVEFWEEVVEAVVDIKDKMERMWRVQKERRRIWVAKMEERDVVALVDVAIKFVFVVVNERCSARTPVLG
jgi:acyl-CoA hydrolase